MIADTPLVDEVRPSPNHGERREGKRPDILLLHYTGMASAETGACECAVAWLCASESQVSCHYVVDTDGRILQLVPEARRAWHAGEAFWAGERDINSRSIGVEIVNPGHDAGCPDFPDDQVAAVVALARDVCRRWGIPPERVLGHSDVAPLRKADPGEKFPWDRLAEAGAALPRPSGRALDIAGMQEDCRWAAAFEVQSNLAQIGYDIAPSAAWAADTPHLLRAFQRRWRPERVDGIADRETTVLLRALAARTPRPTEGSGAPP